ncbi:MAG: OsmC family protein [Epsilonproteobacteria bacterium]|nr:OsmC family protein [Campylobacterota bacterium]
MKITARNIDDLTFEIDNGKSKITIDPHKFSPVEVFGGAMISCSGVDVVYLARKQGFNITKCEIELDATRSESYPQIFTEITIIYDINSDAEDIKAKRWVLSSLETYCSTINTIRNTTKIYYTIKHNDNVIAYKETIISATSQTTPSFDDDLEVVGCACCSH